MIGFTQRIVDWNRDGRKENRRCGRIRVELVRSNLGEIVDMSASGMRVRRRSYFKPKVGKTRVMLRTVEGVSTIPARVVRVHSAGKHLWELGIEFEDVSEEIRATLVGIARVSAMRSIVPTMPGEPLRRSA